MQWLRSCYLLARDTAVQMLRHLETLSLNSEVLICNSFMLMEGLLRIDEVHISFPIILFLNFLE